MDIDNNAIDSFTTEGLINHLVFVRCLQHRQLTLQIDKQQLLQNSFLAQDQNRGFRNHEKLSP